ncbi:MAG: type II toxin-antitoxin system Phd/YefM family antitoxin [Oscillospiraceae bacterium]|jgi:antitoxin Phd|nr:type II toxin-antitoxin system Phd/YefM family antitoxin [Oscillospiraceae bacterium]
MTINTDSIVSISDANQNFSRVARLADENGIAVILKNNTPRYVLIEFSQLSDDESAPDDDVLQLSRRVLERNRDAYERLAK